jgi:hypothetical protein
MIRAGYRPFNHCSGWWTPDCQSAGPRAQHNRPLTPLTDARATPTCSTNAIYWTNDEIQEQGTLISLKCMKLNVIWFQSPEYSNVLCLSSLYRLRGEGTIYSKLGRMRRRDQSWSVLRYYSRIGLRRPKKLTKSAARTDTRNQRHLTSGIMSLHSVN